jgi:hypothetical protein
MFNQQYRSTYIIVGFLVSFVLVATFHYPAHAAYLKAYATASVKVATHGGTYLETVMPTPKESISASPVSVDTGIITTSTFLSGSTAVQARASANYGSLGGYAMAKAGYLPNDPTYGQLDYGGGGDASAAFYDKWTIGGSTGTGQILFNFSINGDIIGTIAHPYVHPGASWGIGIAEDSSSIITSWDYSTNSGRKSGSFTLAKNFTFGTPFDFGIVFFVGAGDPPIPNGSTSALCTADYSSTATLTSINVLDNTGAVVNNYTFTTESKHNYFGSNESNIYLPVIMNH